MVLRIAFNFTAVLNLFVSLLFLAAPVLRGCAALEAPSGSCSPVAVRGLLAAAASLEARRLSGGSVVAACRLWACGFQ